MFSRLSLPRWTGSVATYCENNLRFNEPKLSGPFNFAGREYLREMLDGWSDDSIRDMVGCMGTRTGKTRAIFGGLAWKVEHSPTRALYTMPNTHGTGGAQNVSRTRLQPMFRASPTLKRHIPTGANRFDFKSLQMIINGSIIDLTGVNSPANLAGNPCDTVIQDEVDKYMRRGEAEADPAKLADNRCKEFANPKRVKFSTPTLVSGLIWQELLKSDCRRRFVPCPHCGKHVVFIWSKQFTILDVKDVPAAEVRWDDDAKREDGTWDMGRVEKSARAVCPHCQGHIRDEHKVAMDAKGEWRPTKEATPGYRGWHLPSMYSVSAETGFGRMAVRFLTAKKSIQGLQDFINSDLAEPYLGQDTTTKRTTVIEKIEIKDDEWLKILTVDFHQKAPRFWYIVKAWKAPWPSTHCHTIEANCCDTWEEVEEIQKRHGIKPECVVVDSGYESAEVYNNCADRGERHETQSGMQLSLGWTPAKGFDGRKRFRDPDTGAVTPFAFRKVDAYPGTASAHTTLIELLEFASDYFKDIMANLRDEGWGKKLGFVWSVDKDAGTEIYWRHMDGQVRDDEKNRWKNRHRYWPDHLFDCEKMQVVYAVANGIISLENKKSK